VSTSVTFDTKPLPPLRRLVIRLPNWLGDIIMALPALRAVRARWPDAHLAAAVPRAFAPLAEAAGGVDAVVPLVPARGWRDREAAWADTAALAAGRFDVALLLTNSFGSAWLARRAGIPERWGYGGPLRSGLLTRAVPRPRRRAAAVRHHARYYARLVEALGCRVDTYRVRIDVPAAWRDAAVRQLAARGVGAEDEIVAFAPGAAYGSAKRWPPPLVAAAIDRVARDLGAVPVLVGTPADRPTAQAIHAALAAAAPARERTRVVDLVGETDVPALAGVIARARAFVSNDSGAMHLAAAAGTPVVAVFGPTDEHETAPLGPHVVVSSPVWCRPCLRRECPLDHRCMRTIGPTEVYGAIAGLIAGARTA
jgi:heptosyltransferase-2